MINVMDWLTLLIAIGTALVTATAVVIGIRVQLIAWKESTAREIESLKTSHRRDIELLQVEAKECRERIDNLLTMLARGTKPSNGD